MKYSELDNVAKEYGINQSGLYTIPANVDVKMLLISGYEVLVRHFVEDSEMVRRGYYTCIGKKNNCPFCPDDGVMKQFVFYALIDGEIKLAALPWAVAVFMRDRFNESPELFDANENPKFYINVYRAGAGKETRYTVEKAENIDESELQKYSMDEMDENDIKKFIDKKKEETKKIISAMQKADSDAETGEEIKITDIPF